jgi:hypothetical protein
MVYWSEYLDTDQEVRVRLKRYHIFWERGLVSKIEELLESKSSCSGLENREHGCRDPSRWPRGNPLSAKVGTNSGRSVAVSLADLGHGVS